MKQLRMTVFLTVIVAGLWILVSPAEAGRTQNRQLFTLCTLGLPGSQGASDCEQIWTECASNGKKWRKKNCRISFYPSTHDQAQRMIEDAIKRNEAQGQ